MQVAPHCYAVLGLACLPPWTVNAGIVVGRRRTLVVDTGATEAAARTIHGYAAGLRPGNSLLAINTEEHLDHLGGNALFRSWGIDVFGHQDIHRQPADLAEDLELLHQCIPEPERRARREEVYFYGETRVANPNRPISGEMTFDLGDLLVEVILTCGHTETNVSIHVPTDRVLYTGDCVVAGYAPNLSCASAGGLARWRDSLRRIRALQPSCVVPGHGRVLRGPDLEAEWDRIDACLARADSPGPAA